MCLTALRVTAISISPSRITAINDNRLAFHKLELALSGLTVWPQHANVMNRSKICYRTFTGQVWKRPSLPAPSMSSTGKATCDRRVVAGHDVPAAPTVLCTFLQLCRPPKKT